MTSSSLQPSLSCTSATDVSMKREHEKTCVSITVALSVATLPIRSESFVIGCGQAPGGFFVSFYMSNFRDCNVTTYNNSEKVRVSVEPWPQPFSFHHFHKLINLACAPFYISHNNTKSPHRLFCPFCSCFITFLSLVFPFLLVLLQFHHPQF